MVKLGSLATCWWSDFVVSVLENDDDRRYVVNRSSRVWLKCDAFGAVMWFIQMLSDVSDGFFIAECVPQAVTSKYQKLWPRKKV